METIDEIVEKLSKNSFKSLDDPEINNLYQQVENFRKQDESNTAVVLDIISKQHRPTTITGNTAGSYLWGCAQNYYGNVNKSCSLLCLNSIPYPPSNSTSNLSTSTSNPTSSFPSSIPHSNDFDCQYSIWYFSNNKLEKKNNVSNSKAYIYVDNEWEGFSPSDLLLLSSNSIYFATILTTNDLKHKIIIPMTSIDSLPVIKTLKQTFENESNTSSYFFIFIIIAIFLYFLYLFYFLYFKSTSIIKNP
jgi:hypothetical protein